MGVNFNLLDTAYGDRVLDAAAIAAIMGEGGDTHGVVNTAITTVGNGTLTGAAVAGGLITRTGPVGPFSDATDTAADIIGLFPDAYVGQSFYLTIKNTTQFAQTITAGANVTLLGSSAIIPPISAGTYLVTFTSLTAVSFLHVQTVPLTTLALMAATALSTVGAATITGAGIAGGYTTRTGTQSGSPFIDTTDTAANIIAAQPNAHVGQSWEWNYFNNTNAVSTITGGMGVTLSAIITAQPRSWVRYLVTYTGAGAVSIVGVASGFIDTANGTFVANGVTPVTVANANVTVGSIVLITLKTPGGTVGVSSPAIQTITPGTGFTVSALALDTSTYNYLILG